MSASEVSEFQRVVETVRQWPDAERRRLVREVRAMSAAPGECDAATFPSSPAPLTLDEFRASLPPGPPPTDEEIEQWLHERRLRKSG